MRSNMIIKYMFADQDTNCMVVNMRLFHSSLIGYYLLGIGTNTSLYYPPEATLLVFQVSLSPDY